MRTAPATIDAMLDQSTARDHSLTLARCVKIVLRDGTEMGFTDHDRDLVVPVSNDSYEPLTYRAGHGLIVGDLDLALGLDADSTEFSAPINELISREAVLARRFNHAKTYIFDVDWTLDEPLPLELMGGSIADSRNERHMAVFEIRSLNDYWNVTVGSLLTPRCRADFGDVKCGVTPVNRLVAVSQVISTMRFAVDIAEDIADDFYRFGEAEFLTGDLAGTWPYEIVAFDSYTHEVETLSPMPGFPEVGDQLFLRNGCSKVKELPADPTVPTCATYQNWRRFRGFDQVPGSDRFLRFPVPGNG